MNEKVGRENKKAYEKCEVKKRRCGELDRG
jgi:hypothetical protein